MPIMSSTSLERLAVGLRHVDRQVHDEAQSVAPQPNRSEPPQRSVRAKWAAGPQRYRWQAIGTVALLFVGGCAQAPSPRHQIQHYDLGPPQTAGLSANVQPSPSLVLKVLAVSASAALDSDDIAYRLVYANPNQARHYSGSEWTATPAQLMTERLRGKLAQTSHLLEGGDPEDAPLLKVELLDFSQRFDAPGHGQGVVSIRATLKTRTRLIAQRDFTASVPSATANAEGGATAIAQAADAVLDNLSAWATHSAAAQ